MEQVNTEDADKQLQPTEQDSMIVVVAIHLAAPKREARWLRNCE